MMKPGHTGVTIRLKTSLRFMIAISPQLIMSHSTFQHFISSAASIEAVSTAMAEQHSEAAYDDASDSNYQRPSVAAALQKLAALTYFGDGVAEIANQVLDFYNTDVLSSFEAQAVCTASSSLSDTITTSSAAAAAASTTAAATAAATIAAVAASDESSKSSSDSTLRATDCSIFPGTVMSSDPMHLMSDILLLSGNSPTLTELSATSHDAFCADDALHTSGSRAASTPSNISMYASSMSPFIAPASSPASSPSQSQLSGALQSRRPLIIPQPLKQHLSPAAAAAAALRKDALSNSAVSTVASPPPNNVFAASISGNAARFTQQQRQRDLTSSESISHAPVDASSSTPSSARGAQSPASLPIHSRHSSLHTPSAFMPVSPTPSLSLSSSLSSLLPAAINSDPGIYSYSGSLSTTAAATPRSLLDDGSASAAASSGVGMAPSLPGNWNRAEARRVLDEAASNKKPDPSGCDSFLSESNEWLLYKQNQTLPLPHEITEDYLMNLADIHCDMLKALFYKRFVPDKQSALAAKQASGDIVEIFLHTLPYSYNMFIKGRNSAGEEFYVDQNLNRATFTAGQPHIQNLATGEWQVFRTDTKPLADTPYRQLSDWSSTDLRTAAKRLALLFDGKIHIGGQCTRDLKVIALQIPTTDRDYITHLVIESELNPNRNERGENYLKKHSIQSSDRDKIERTKYQYQGLGRRLVGTAAPGQAFMSDVQFDVNLVFIALIGIFFNGPRAYDSKGTWDQSHVCHCTICLAFRTCAESRVVNQRRTMKCASASCGRVLVSDLVTSSTRIFKLPTACHCELTPTCMFRDSPLDRARFEHAARDEKKLKIEFWPSWLEAHYKSGTGFESPPCELFARLTLASSVSSSSPHSQSTSVLTSSTSSSSSSSSSLTAFKTPSLSAQLVQPGVHTVQQSVQRALLLELARFRGARLSAIVAESPHDRAVFELFTELLAGFDANEK